MKQECLSAAELHSEKILKGPTLNRECFLLFNGFVTF